MNRNGLEWLPEPVLGGTGSTGLTGVLAPGIPVPDRNPTWQNNPPNMIFFTLLKITALFRNGMKMPVYHLRLLKHIVCRKCFKNYLYI